MDDMAIRCTECHRDVDEFTAIKERWRFWSDGSDLLPYCRDCSEREFGGEATEQVPLVHSRAKTNGL